MGRAADLTILQKRLDDPYDNVVSAYPSWVDMVMIGGDIIYGRPDWVAELSTPADYEPVTAWGRPMLLDTRFGSPEDAGIDGPPRRLAEMRAKLIARYPGRRPDLRLTTQGPPAGQPHRGIRPLDICRQQEQPGTRPTAPTKGGRR